VGAGVPKHDPDYDPRILAGLLLAGLVILMGYLLYLLWFG
jgi:hypothetical protein